MNEVISRFASVHLQNERLICVSGFRPRQGIGAALMARIHEEAVIRKRRVHPA
jgi:hypothetical protein